MEKKTIVVVDGNDGTGKTVLVERLRTLGYEAQERGAPSILADDIKVEMDPRTFALILDADPLTSISRLRQRGADLRSPEYTIDALAHYRRRYLRVARSLGPARAHVINAERSSDEVLRDAMLAIEIFEDLLAWEDAGVVEIDPHPSDPSEEILFQSAESQWRTV